MTLDEKVRLGIAALGGASMFLSALGLHIGPISTGAIGGVGD